MIPASLAGAAAAGKAFVHTALREASRDAHQEISEIEHENVGLEAAHKAEMAVESTVRTGKRAAGAALRFHRSAPTRRAAKLGKRAMRANVKLSYQKALRENPKLKGSALSRFIQKRKIKRQHAKAYRQAKRAGGAIKRGGQYLNKGVSVYLTHNNPQS